MVSSKEDLYGREKLVLLKNLRYNIKKTNIKTTKKQQHYNT